MITNSTPEKTIRSIIVGLCWYMSNDFTLEELENSGMVNEGLADITRIIEECKPTIRGHSPQPMSIEDCQRGLDEFERELKERIG